MRERTALDTQISAIREIERGLEDALGFAQLAEEEGD